ncbi:MAG TPA: hypothetical protein VK936_13790 [Longimicrobiales bacterium]|nr:hypothetical protein [Longimicrobiales bacterium]
MLPRLSVLATCAALLFGAGPAHAQDGFLFKRPSAQLTLKGGPLIPRAHSELFDFMVDTLTLERSDFRTPWIGADFAILVGPRLDVALGVAFAETESRSEFRYWEGVDGLPIEQTTRLRTVPVTVTARYHLLDRGREVSSLAWIPNRVTPYLAGGAGLTWYRLLQEGEFVGQPVGDDPLERDIFVSRLQSRGYGLTGHAGAGLDYWFSPRVGLNTELRYMVGSAPVGGDYRGRTPSERWDDIDLSGFQAAVGLTFRW